MELKDFCLTDDCRFISPHRLMDSSSSSSSSPADEVQSPDSGLSPSHRPFLLPSPTSSSSSSCSSSYSLLCGAPESDSPTGSISSGGGVAAAVCFPTDSFSAQVDLILRGDYLTPAGAVGAKRLCLVCGDLASGYHYGVASCEACKAFFKRTIQGNIEYSCPLVKECEITKRRRKACQACRFHKCLQAGMMREGVRMDRVRGGRQKYKRRLESLSCYSRAAHSLQAVGSEFPQEAPTQQHHNITTTSPQQHHNNTTTTPQRHHNFVTTSPLLPHVADVLLTLVCLLGNKVVSHLLLTDPAPLAANQDDSTNDGSLRDLLTLCDLLNRELLLLIGWAKQIPGFSGLSLVDQMSLLQSGWMEALLVGVAWRSQAAEGEELVFAGNLRLDRAQCRAAGLADLYEALRHLTARYQVMDLSPEEVVTLKAMALANSDADPVDGPDSVQRLQDALQEALQQQEASCRGRRRAGRLLLSLPLLRQTAGAAAANLLRLHRHGGVPLHRLLLEMLDAKA
ncbi:steroid hormone receptor ERR1-like [Clinocottus analis]|uniref:steroid hormone receptor ERR1-like n=1 Tax=Clinocottus analis TaxID=304258 RepID=UPI0035C0BED5